ncbi:hypothetical protein ACA910_013207 [Epithemia clementina (nom. ined.)]
MEENLQDEERPNMIALLEPSYGAALQSAYDQSSKALTSDVHIQLDLPPRTTKTRTPQHGAGGEEEEEVATARGLELDLMPTNTVQKLTLKHRRAVLLVQEKLRSDGRCMSDEFCLELLAKASRRYSRPSRLVALKLGEYDSSCTNNATTTTTSTTTTSEPPEEDLLDTSSTEMDTTTTTTTTTGRTESSVVFGVVVAAAKNQQTTSLSSSPSPSSSSSHMQSSKKNSILWSQGAHEESFYEQQ